MKTAVSDFFQSLQLQTNLFYFLDQSYKNPVTSLEVFKTADMNTGNIHEAGKGKQKNV